MAVPSTPTRTLDTKATARVPSKAKATATRKPDARPELTFEEFCAQPMELVMHISGEKEHYLHRHAKNVGVSKITITRVNKYGGFGKQSSTYHMGDDKRVFKEADQVYLAYMEKVCEVTT